MGNRFRQGMGFLLIWLSGLAFSGQPETVVVIVNADNTEAVDTQFIKNVYSDRIESWENGEPIHLYELPPRSLVRDRFYRGLLGISARMSETAWNNRKITNALRNLPPRVRRESRLISAVMRDQQGIGYVSESALNATNAHVRIIHRLE